ncbi:pullulanase-type alpha-1,6-glucosidase [Aeromonas hydrophila]|uniref:Pullulanase-type alpha-1,6-glucosidase n=2 Tax=Aeromonas hydrophila TaxID=644 RepID=A0AAX3P3V1_AERHY|nr:MULTISPECIES: pullulanase-type alpha-1,6-glucosidase [Aeromonas]MCO4115083.1 pullulanase-type alpha-1,6-glucosidase [Aeromonas hydrophila]MCV9382910.1 pullulanase-type alpha-1,6-glucosidase [Aeromonas hydrophila]MDD9225571.1 pullulanase-type alpha-1,6-glucosidase [Aeromonas hydrophila]WEA29570.1 pullulanase-type alpha-1,6-glucosidase [Aeromonas hydrophila]WEE25564.1 pullulanase-type alpha-1,6-glucosidase [Aeromonas hydrophila]
MDMKKTKVALVTASLLALLSGCNDNSSSPSTPDPTDGPVARLPNVQPPAEQLVAGPDQAVIALVDTQTSAARGVTGPFANYSLHLWNNDACSATAESGLNAGWDDKVNTPAAADGFGPSWVVPLSKLEGCINFIARNGDLANLTGSDMKVVFSDHPDRTVAIVAGKNEIFGSRAEAFTAAFGVAGASAHLIDGNTLIWQGGKDKPHVRLYYTESGTIKANAEGVFDFPYITLTPTSLTAEQQAKYPHLKDAAAFALPAGKDLKPLLKGELVAIGTDADGILQGATLVQSAGALDALYSEAATKLTYGAVVEGGNVTFRLWAPTAKSVKLALFDGQHKPLGERTMTLDEASGSWSVQGGSELVGKFYRYDIQVYHPVSRKLESYQVTDPYSLSLAMNSEFSQVVDLNDPALKPEGWDSLKAPHSQQNPADITIYEAHVRDLTGNDDSTPAEHRGKFLGLTDTDTAPVKHLQALAKSGVSHLHLLPVFDIATVNEDPAKVANISDDFGKLCQVNPEVQNSKFAGYCSSGQTIEAVLGDLQGSDSKENPQVQELYGYLRGVDSFNWGYDPYHYTTPEGSYATNAEGSQRILEFREMVKAIKQNIGMNVVMDVVYNHTNEAGLGPKSVLDKIVPWYYQRLNPETGSVENSTCCSNTAPEHAMFAKLMDDSLVTWARDYKIDAFRFDLMGHHPKDQMVQALAAVKKVNPEMYFYGEGWNFGEVQDDKRFVQATQKHLAGTGIGSFSDRLRDAVRGGSPFDGGDTIRKTQGFGNGALVDANEMDGVDRATALHQADLVRLGMAGNLKDFILTDKDGMPKKGSDIDYNGQPAGYAQDPTEIQNYVDKHDNQTLFDNLIYKAPQGADLVRMQGVSLATAMLGQGIPFTHAGVELLRSKSMERDSYDSGDWYNRVDYGLNDNNFDKGLPRKDKDGDNYPLIEQVLGKHVKPSGADMATMVGFYQELAELRQSSRLLRLGSGAEVIKRVDFRNTGPDQEPGLIVMTVDDGVNAGADLDPAIDGLVVMINATNAPQSVSDFRDGNDQPIDLTSLQLSPAHHGGESIARDAAVNGGTLTLGAWSAAVFVKPQSGAQGTGLPVGKKTDLSTVPPFGDTAVYLKGFLNEWGNTNQMTFSSNFMYEFTTEVSSDKLGTTNVKIADASWGPLNYGSCNAGDKLVVGTPLTLCKGGDTGNIGLDLAKAGSYKFVFTAMNKDKPTLSVSFTEPVQSCKVLDTVAGNPLGYNLFVKGELSGWAAQPQYQLSYKGMDGDLAIYQAAFNYTGSTEFKVANEDWSKEYLLNGGGAVTAETGYAIGFSQPGSANNSITLPQGLWSVQVKVDPAGTKAGTAVIQECSAK